MTVKQLQELLNLKCISEGSEDRELEGGFCGDLLSRYSMLPKDRAH